MVLCPPRSLVRSFVLGELILSGGDDQLQHFGRHAGRRSARAPPLSQRHWPHSLACENQLLAWCRRRLRPGPADRGSRRPAARGLNVPLAFSRLMMRATPGSDVSPTFSATKLMRAIKRAAVDPLLAGVPSLDRRRIEQVLAHIGGVHRQLAIAGLRDLVAADQAAACRRRPRPAT